jgi:hypothetical protein
MLLRLLFNYQNPHVCTFCATWMYTRSRGFSFRPRNYFEISTSSAVSFCTRSFISQHRYRTEVDKTPSITNAVCAEGCMGLPRNAGRYRYRALPTLRSSGLNEIRLSHRSLTQANEVNYGLGKLMQFFNSPDFQHQNAGRLEGWRLVCRQVGTQVAYLHC